MCDTNLAWLCRLMTGIAPLKGQPRAEQLFEHLGNSKSFDSVSRHDAAMAIAKAEDTVLVRFNSHGLRKD